MPRLVLDEPKSIEQNQEGINLVLDNNVSIDNLEQNSNKPRLVLDEPKYEQNDFEKIISSFVETNPLPFKFFADSFKAGDEIVNNIADKMEVPVEPGTSNIGLVKYFPAYFAAELVRAYTPSNIVLSYVGGKALGITGKAISKYIPQSLKEKIGRLLVYRFGQPEAYKELAENRIMNIAKGFSKAEEIGKKLSDGLDVAEQLRLGQVMRGGITTNPKLQALAEPARQMVDDLSKELIKQGVPSERLAEVIENNLGTYLPRLYRQKEMEVSLNKILGSKKPVRIDLSSLKRRKDIPQEIRKKMGEILEPAYPTAKAVGQMTQMTETSKLFNSVASNPEWVSDIAVEGFEKLPKNEALGRLSGKYVLKSIADDVNDITVIEPKLFKDYKKALSLWKAGKTILNPATHARNMMSNTILLDMSGVNHIKQSVLLPRALKDLAIKGKYYQEAQSVNLLGNEFYASELKHLIDNFPQQSNNFIEFALNSTKNIFKKSYSKAGELYQAEEQWFKLAKFISEREKGSTIKEAAQQAEKWLFNYSKVTPAVKKISQTVAPFATFTYKVLPRIAESVTQNPLKAYKYIALAKAFEGASEKTLGLDEKKSSELKQFLPEWLKGFGKYALLMPLKDKEGRYQYLDLTYILPIGLVSNITEQGGAWNLVSNPLLTLFTELKSNKQIFSGKEIWKETDTEEEKLSKQMDYIYRQIMPSLAPAIPPITKGGYSWQKLQSAIDKRPDYFGRERSLPLTVMDVLGGIKVSPVDLKQQRMFTQKEKNKSLMDLKFEAKSIIRNQSLRPEEKKIKIEKIREKMREVQSRGRK